MDVSVILTVWYVFLADTATFIDAVAVSYSIPYPRNQELHDVLPLPDSQQKSQVKELRSVTELNHESSHRELLYHHVTSRRQTCTPGSEEMSRRLAVINCDQRYVEAALDLINREDVCGFDFLNSDFNRCGTNHNGELCAVHDPRFIRFNGTRGMVDVAGDIILICFQNIGGTLQNCSSECRQMLEEFSDRFGCCIHTEPRLKADDAVGIFALNLWSQCDVTRPEPCDDSPPITIVPRSLVDDTCSFLCIVTQSIFLECKYLARERLQLFEDCGDLDAAWEMRQICGFNEKGDYCGGNNGGTALSFLDDNSRRNLAFSIYNKCFRFFSGDECTTECRETLQDTSDELGCCVNSMNSTVVYGEGSVEVLTTRYDLWSKCGVQTPGFCHLPTDPSVYDRYIQCNTCSRV